MNTGIPETGFVRLAQIIGNPKADPPVVGVIPLGKSSWWEGVKSGRFPQPVKLSTRCTAWRAEDIHDLIKQLGEQKPRMH
ncbi:MAG TPA: AlpA family phage regulatory protein [Verrucomicrobiae bacterium]|nr:AlpA family phage regulatory protein [Verrucomicrobiae bacterium]